MTNDTFMTVNLTLTKIAYRVDDGIDKVNHNLSC